MDGTGRELDVPAGWSTPSGGGKNLVSDNQVDGLGRTIESLPLGAEGVLDAPLPQPVSPPLYARTGDLPAVLVVLLTLVVAAGLRLREGYASRAAANPPPA